VRRLLSVVYGGILKKVGLDGHIIQSKQLQDIALKVVPAKVLAPASGNGAISGLRNRQNDPTESRPTGAHA
jgi:hypothetical protein